VAFSAFGLPVQRASSSSEKYFGNPNNPSINFFECYRVIYRVLSPIMELMEATRFFSAATFIGFPFGK
jgi:hypothetical protein